MSNKQKELPQTLPRWEVPDSWKWVSLADVGQVITGNTPPTSDKNNYGNDIPYVKPPELVDRGIWTTPNGLSEKGASIARTLPAGAVLVSCIGGLGKTGLAKVPVAFNQQINAIIFNECVIPEYGFYYAQTLNEWLQGVSSATTLPIVNKGKFQRAPIPIAPPEQQKSIVAEIEKQFSRLDEAVANLKRVKANLKRYKAAVLKAAVEGKLTEEWRKQNPDVEPAEKLLERILAERREKWQGRGKYKEPAAPDTTDLPELPEGWGWSNFEQLSEAIPNSLKAGPFGSALKKSFYVPEGYKVYGQEQVIREDPYYGDYFIDEERYESLKSCAIKPGDMLISLVGTIGRVLILPEDSEPGIINPRLVKISLNTDIVEPLYIKIFLQSPFVKYLFALASHGGTMDILNLGILKGIPVPIPPLLEQKAILNEFASFSSVEERLEDTVGANQARSNRLRQSILKKAFSGQLLPSSYVAEK